jgi:hypothetical protein
MSIHAKRSVAVDQDQLLEVEDYCRATGATKAWVVREALAAWLQKVKPRNLKYARKAARPVVPEKKLLAKAAAPSE